MITEDWKESEWSWAKAIEELKYFSNKTSDDYDPRENEILTLDSGVTAEEFKRHETFLKILITDVAKIIGTSLNDEYLENEINKVINFEKKLDTFYRKHRTLKKKSSAIKKYNRNIIWLNTLQPFLVANHTKFDGELEEDFETKYLEFLETTPKR